MSFFHSILIFPLLLVATFFSKELNIASEKKNNSINNSIEETPCNKPPNPQATKDFRFLPQENDPIKELKVNLIFLHRPANPAKGIAASKERDADYQKYIDDIIRYMGFQLEHFLYEENPGQCSDVRIDSRIRLDIQKLFIDNSYYWNNENDSCDTGCPYLRNCDWYAAELADSLNAGLTDAEKRINIFFTENETIYERVFKEELPKDLKFSGDCSMGYKTDFDIDARIHMRNEYIGFRNRFWYAEANDVPIETVLKWGYVGAARLLLHEIGHTIFGAGHINNSCNIMNGKYNYNQEHIQDQQLQEAHRVLSTHNMRKYVKPTNGLCHSIITKPNEKINYDLQLWGNLIVPENEILTVTCQLRMSPNSKIILRKGAELIVDGGTISPAFENTSWFGIDQGKEITWFDKIFKRKTESSISKVTLINDGQIIL